ncbi:MAG: oligosaccharide flippase family protein [Bacteroides sp.]|nr:oligosaccharide flippase family protein [Bacteroides sp.]
MAVIMIVNLYTVRIVLKALGLEDYGIYNVVAGIITMLICINNVMANATQRYYSFSLGKQNHHELNDIFNISAKAFFYFSGIVILLGETVGLWFVNYKLNIPEARMMATNWIYQFSILTFVCSITMIPYTAAIIAHEDMNIYSILSSLEYVVKLIFAFFLFIIPLDRLATYGALMFIAHFMLLVAYMIICHRKYPECKYGKVRNKDLFKGILSFSGWNLFGSLAGVGMTQVGSILTTIFFGPIVNAARAIAMQVNTAVMTFSNNIILAVRSPMIKSYAEENYPYLNFIFSISNKFIFIGMLMIILPLECEMGTILRWWLGTQDSQAVLFSRMIVIYAMLLALANPITVIIQATGKLKQYHMSVEFFTLLCPVLTYFAFKAGYPASISFTLMIICMVIAHVVRVICLKSFYPDFNLIKYIIGFCIPAIILSLISGSITFWVNINEHNDILRLILTVLVSISTISLLSLVILFSKEEKQLAIEFLKSKLVRKIHS